MRCCPAMKLVLALVAVGTRAWAPMKRAMTARFKGPNTDRVRALVVVYKGNGYLPDGSYSWTENDDELEVRVIVPNETRASDISMQLSQSKIELTLEKTTKLLQGTLRGKVATDGSYWSIETLANTGQRAVVLTLEKKVDGLFDPEEWMGVILDAREAGSKLSYDMDKREEFDVKEYIDSMGGYDESIVDKTMFKDVSDVRHVSHNSKFDHIFF